MANAHPSTNRANLKASVEGYLVTTVGTSTFPAGVDDANSWDFGQRQDWELKNYRVRPVMRYPQGQAHARVSASEAGIYREPILFVDVFAKRAKYPDDLAVIEKALFKIRSAFPINGQVEVFNRMNDTGAAAGASLGHLSVLSVDEVAVPQEDTWKRGQLVVEFAWIEVGDNV